VTPVNGHVDRAARTIVDNSAESVKSIFVGVASHLIAGALPLTAVVPGADGAIGKAIDLLEEEDIESTIEFAAQSSKGRVSKLAGRALKHATGLLVKILGEEHRGPVLAQARTLVGQGVSDSASPPSLAGGLMGRLFDLDHVVIQGSEVIDDDGWYERVQREARLERLRRANRLWVGPVQYLSRGLGPLWLLPLPIGIPVAPIVAGALIVYVILISGDQLDSQGAWPDFWRGVVRRSSGDRKGD